MSTTYTPREGSAVWKTVEYLTTHPTESLTAEAIASKWDVGIKSVHTILGAAVQAGILNRTEDLKLGELVYRFGKGHPSIGANPAGAPSLSAAEASAHAAPPSAPAQNSLQRRAPFWLDISKVEIEAGRPLPGARGSVIEWDRLFDRLKVGDSFPLPVEGRSAIGKATQRRRSAKGEIYAIRSEGEALRVWRTA